MLVNAPQNLSREYLNTIEEQFPVVYFESLQILDVIHRQALMISEESKYKYDRDRIMPELANVNLSPKDRFKLLRRYIADWEQRNGGKFSLASVKISEADLDTEAVKDYEDIRKTLLKLRDEGNTFLLDEDVLQAFLGKLQRTLSESINAANQGDGANHLKFDRKTMAANFAVDAIPYFSRYIGFGMGIFKPYLTEKGVERYFSALISLKINFEHQAHKQQVQRLTPVQIRSRIKASPSLYKDRLATSPEKLGLISPGFIEYLVTHEADLY